MTQGSPKKRGASGGGTRKKTGGASGPVQGDLFEAAPPPKSAPRKKAAAKTPAKKETPPAPAKRPAPSRSAASPPKTRAAAPKKQRSAEEYEATYPAPSLRDLPLLTLLCILYAGVVLTYDYFAMLGDVRTVNWAVFAWRPGQIFAALKPWADSAGVPALLVNWLDSSLLAQFDLFKLVMWGVVPLLMCLWWLDLEWFRFNRWKPLDRKFFWVCGALGVAAVISVRFIPQLSAAYPGMGGTPFSERAVALLAGLLWVVSWLPAWEFLHRYFLLRRLSADFPRFGWLLVPLAETLYHTQKPWPEMAGMLVFSIAATQWTLRRGNLMLPFLVHLVIEVALLILLVF